MKITSLFPSSFGVLAVAFFCFASTASAVDEPKDKTPWKITGQLEEACSCDAACPCWFGSKPTKMTCGGGQVILVGLEPNQQGHAASHEQASSSWPVIFHGVLSFGLSAAPAVEAKQKNVTASTPNDEGKSDVVFMVRILTASRVPDKTILWCCSRHPAGDAMRRCLQISAALRTAKRLQEKSAGDEARTRDVLLGKEVLYH